MKNVHTIVGPPGTGKTTRLAAEVAKAIKNGVKQEDIYMLSFTRAAAKETAAKVGDVKLGRVSTLHSLCYSLLQVGAHSMMNRRHLDKFSQSVGMAMAGISGDTLMGTQDGDRCMAILQYARARHLDPLSVYVKIRHRPCAHIRFMGFCKAYAAYKKANALYDFDDLLEQVTLIEDNLLPTLDMLVIDEAQDLSPLQWKVVSRLLARSKRGIIAGDPDQALYEWGGSAPLYMVSKEITGSIEVLSKSYRVPIVLHKIAERLAGAMGNRFEREYEPCSERGSWRFTSSPELIKFDKENTLILTRTNLQKNIYEKCLWQDRIPYSCEGGKKSLFSSPRADAVRAIRAIQAGALPHKQLVDSLKRHGKPQVIGALDKDLMKVAQGKPIWELIYKPRDQLEEYYLESVDLDATPTVRLSTIHASKGREADRVVLHMGTTKRIQQGYVDFPDAEIRCWYVGVTRAKKHMDFVWGNNPLLPWMEILGEGKSC